MPPTHLVDLRRSTSPILRLQRNRHHGRIQSLREMQAAMLKSENRVRAAEPAFHLLIVQPHGLRWRVWATGECGLSEPLQDCWEPAQLLFPDEQDGWILYDLSEL